MADAMRPDFISDEEIAAAVGDELPDRAAMSIASTGCPDDFVIAADALVPPGPDTEPPPDAPELAES